jgi:hypothetical protein
VEADIMTEYEWGEVRDLIYRLLHLIYVERRENFQVVAARTECSLEDLAARTLAGWLRDYMGDAIRPGPNGNPLPRSKRAKKVARRR